MANADLNMVALTGRLTREGDLRYTQGGMAILNFSIAVNRVRRQADGSRADETSFFDCVYFGKAAEGINQYLEKGKQVAINGELRQDRWEQDGQTRSKVQVYVNSITLIGGGSRNGQDGGFQGNGGYQRNNYQNNNGGYQNNSYQNGGNGYQSNGSYNRSNNGYGQSGNMNNVQRNVPPQSADIDDQIKGGPETFDDDVIPF